MYPRHLFLLLSGLLVALLLTCLPAQAQQPDPPPDSPAYSTLADLLENDTSRNRLIEELRGLAQQESVAGLEGNISAEAIIASRQAAQEVSLPRRLAEATSSIASYAGSQFTNMVSAIDALFRGQPGDGAFDLDGLITATINLALVIIATFALFLGFRRLARQVFTRLNQWSLQSGGMTPLVRLVLAVAMAAVVDVLVVALAYVGGNLLATFVIGETGELSIRASLFLNAFLIIELFKAAVRMLFSSRYDRLRLLPISSEEASYWNRWIARLIGIVGYGLMAVVPLINAYLSPALGEAVGTLLMLGAFFYGVTFVLTNRLKLRHGLEAIAERSSLGATRFSLQLLAHIWHWLAILYFLMVLVITLARPADALPFVMQASLYTILLAGAGILISSLLTQTIGHHITLSDDLRRKLPLLEPRLNSYIPNALRFIRFVILAIVVMLVLNVWGVFNLAAWYASDLGRTIVGRTISVAVILMLAVTAWLALASLIEHKLNPETGTGEPDPRAKTLLSLFRNALAIALVTMTLMIVLAQVGINIGPLIAGAGVLGLAIGFGAQRLVQDIITGIFIQIENAMNTGDVVTAGGITGTAERLSIRSVGIRDLSGTYHIVPFSSVDTVSNFMRDFGYHVGEYGIAYRENIDEAIIALREAFDELAADEEHKMNIVAPLEVAGVVALGNSSVNIRVRIKAKPGTHWGIGRAYNRLVKLHFDAKGIEIPFPHTTLYFGQDKTGSAPPANLRVMQQNFTIDGSPAGQPKAAGSQTDDRFDPRARPNPKTGENFDED
nr:mechanosensitive ion channel domain-containing protein [Halomonas populi]